MKASLRTRGARAVADGKRPVILPAAELADAEHLYEIGDVDRAKVLFQRIVDKGHRRRSPVAAYYLGMILKQWGDTTGAKAAFRVAIASGRPRVAGPAASELAQILVEEGDSSFVDVYRLMLDHRDEALVAQAAYVLGRFYLDEDPATARTHLQSAIATGHPGWAPEAALQLGLALSRDGDIAGAMTLMEKAARSPVASSKSEALVWIADHLDGDADQAVSRLREAVAVNDPEWTAHANCLLGHELLRLSHFDGAQAAFRAAVEAEDSEWSPVSMLGLGLVHKHWGNTDDARYWFREAAANGQPSTVRAAEDYLSELS